MKHPFFSIASFLIVFKLTAGQPDDIDPSTATSLLTKLLSAVRYQPVSSDQKPEKIKVPENCSLSLLNENVLRNLEWNYFYLSVQKDGVERFQELRNRKSYYTTYGDLQRILFPSPFDHQHPYFECSYLKFFNHLMNTMEEDEAGINNR